MSLHNHVANLREWHIIQIVILNKAAFGAYTFAAQERAFKCLQKRQGESSQGFPVCLLPNIF
ncbi:MAG: hypothetical protein JNN28_05100 [Saprospiraceae bacterium]|nr:hypothetical protein [Saprospiraceae bacterium]